MSTFRNADNLSFVSKLGQNCDHQTVVFLDHRDIGSSQESLVAAIYLFYCLDNTCIRCYLSVLRLRYGA